MKIHGIIFLIVFLWVVTGKAQCPPGDYIINSQQALDNFIATYPDCTEIPGSLTIQSTNISDLTPINKLTKIGKDLLINNNLNLVNLIGLENIDSVGSKLEIFNNPKLGSIVALQKLKAIKILKIVFNSNLESLKGLDSLSTVGLLTLNNNEKLSDFSSLNNLKQITNGVILISLPLLDDLSFLKNIKEGIFQLVISDNNSLVNLKGLDSLSSFVPYLRISYNMNLESLTGLEKITGFEELDINNNPKLSVCNLQGICDYLDTIPLGHYPNIKENNLGCVSREQILESCNKVSTNEAFNSGTFIFPNPASSYISIQADKLLNNSLVEIYDILGKKVFSKLINDKEQINCENLGDGIYIVRVKIGEGFVSAKLVVNRR